MIAFQRRHLGLSFIRAAADADAVTIDWTSVHRRLLLGPRVVISAKSNTRKFERGVTPTNVNRLL